MKVYVPDYYEEFHCIAGACRHTCCQGWEVDIDAGSLPRFEREADIRPHISYEQEPHIQLLEGEICPFLRKDGLCQMILEHGEDMLCQTCTDHPRFRNFWEDRVEMGLGMVCEEAARLILSRKGPMKLVLLEEKAGDASDESCAAQTDGLGEAHADCKANERLRRDFQNENTDEGTLPEDEAWLMEYRDKLLSEITEEGPFARFREYLIYRHIPNALYEDDLEERVGKIEIACEMLRSAFAKTDGSFEALVECARAFSYDQEYDVDEGLFG